MPIGTTTRLPISGAEAISQAASALRRGELVAFPTDTLYGLGAHGLLFEAVDRLYQVKGRPRHMAIPLLLPDAAAVKSVCVRIPPVVWRLAEHFWPGGLTLVLHRAPSVPDIVTAGRPTVAVRVPDQASVHELCRQLDAPLATTSANRHAQTPAVTADDVQVQLGEQVALILDGGRCPGGLASTILDLTVCPAAILRAGPVTAEQLAHFLPLRG